MSELVKCIELTCGKEFELSDGEITFFKGKGFDLPRRCPICRNRRKMEKAREQGVR